MQTRTSAAIASSADSALGFGHAVASARLQVRRTGSRRGSAAGRIQSRSRRISASSTALVAAPLRRLSETTQKARPRSSGDRHVAPDAPDEDLVATGGLGGQRVDVLGGIVLDDDARDRGEELARTLRA